MMRLIGRCLVPSLLLLTLGSPLGCTSNKNQLRSIAITPPAPSLAAGTELALVATGTYSNYTTADVSPQAEWTSSNPQIVTVDNGGSRGRLHAVAPGTVEVTAALGGVTGRVTVTVTPAQLLSISLTPAAPSLAAGRQLQLVATGTFADNTTQTLTAQVTWTSDTPLVATIDDGAQKGRVTALQPGTTRIAANLGTVRGEVTLTVTAAELVSLAVTPTRPSIARGTTQAFVAMGTFTNNSLQDVTDQVTWSSSDTNVASIGNTQGTFGRATALNVGQTTITVAAGTITGSTLLTVTPAPLRSIGITPATPSLARGTTQPLVAMGTFADNTVQDLTDQVTWASSTPNVADVSNAQGSRGLATALNVGQTTITATFNTIAGSVTLTVTPATLRSISITPPSPSLARDLTLRLTATGTYSDNTTQDLTTQVTWSSSAPGIAAISNAPGSQGLVTALGQGQATITAALGAQSSTTALTVTAAQLTSIVVSPNAPTIYSGQPQAFTANGVYDDNTMRDLTALVTWASSDQSIASVSNAPGSQGLARSLRPGQATITARLGTASGTATLTVNAYPLTTLAITPIDPSIARGTTRAFVATGTYADGRTQVLTDQVTWSSSATSVATISNAPGSQGVASGLAAGQTTISATLGTVSTTTRLTVTAAQLVFLSVTPTSFTLPIGLVQALRATGSFSDGSTQDLTAQVTWTSSDSAVVQAINTSNAYGQALAVGPGQATLTASLGSVSATARATVQNIRLVSLAVTPASATIPIGGTQQFTATGTYDDGSTRDLTTQVAWIAGGSGTVLYETPGLFRGAGEGDVMVVAFALPFGSIQASATLTITAAPLVAITLTPLSPIVAKDTTQRFQATGELADGTTRDLTFVATWASSDEAVATVGLADASSIQVQALAPGQTRVSATFGGVTGSTLLTVTDATLRAIDIQPANPSSPSGVPLQLTAIGRFSDGRQQDLTPQVTWTSAATSIVFFDDPGPFATPGLARAAAQGQTTVSATLGSIVGSARFTVTAPVPSSLLIYPPLGGQPVARQDALLAAVLLFYSDNSYQIVTNQAAWASTDPNIVTVSSSPLSGLELVASKTTPGTVGITASYGGFTAQDQINVQPYDVVALSVSPTIATTAVGGRVPFTASAQWSNGINVSVTDRLLWSSSAPGVATVSINLTGTATAVGVAPGQTTITAQSPNGPLMSSATLTVQ
ncbi:MAG TPA: Ig-like domain-containing protein [Polyangia bacterium]|nr:Ig-like domain-containing protein [Polyangia bacterium]